MNVVIPSLENYRILNAQDILTPALVVYPPAVDSNIQVTLRMAGGDATRWRPHVKTSKISFVMKRMMDFGIRYFKCSTTLELATLCELDAADVLLAFPVVGANAKRVQQLAAKFPNVHMSVLVENAAQAESWRRTGIGLFVDINPGMDRTGISQQESEAVLELVKFIVSLGGNQFRGLHYYDGQISGTPHAERQAAVYQGYDRLLDLIETVTHAGIAVDEVITSGTPATPFALSYPWGFKDVSFVHRISPGTMVYNDMSSLEQLAGFAYKPAVLVLSSVVSHPAPGMVTCDAGHKAVSVDSGVPNCCVLGWPHLVPQKPSEEHLPFRSSDPSQGLPAVGELLYLLPRHVCPTVNNFDDALVVTDGRVETVERVSARGHESPLALR